jgi:hypothetical protein
MRPPRPSEGDRAPHHAPTRILSPSKSLRTKCLWALKETGCPPIKIEIPRKSPKSHFYATHAPRENSPPKSNPLMNIHGEGNFFRSPVSALRFHKAGWIRLDSVGFTLICPRHRTASKHFQSRIQHPQPDLRGRVVRVLAVVAAADRPIIPNKNGSIYLDSVGPALTRPPLFEGLPAVPATLPAFAAGFPAFKSRQDWCDLLGFGWTHPDPLSAAEDLPPQFPPPTRHPNLAKTGLIHLDSVGFARIGLVRSAVSGPVPVLRPAARPEFPPSNAAENGLIHLD